LDVGAELGVEAGFGSAEATVGDLEIKLGMRGHDAKQGGSVLDRVGGDREDAEFALGHDVRRWGSLDFDAKE
jgi:hypothetical protein